MTLAQALQNAFWLLLPALIYAGFVRLRHGLTGAEIGARLGLGFGTPRSYCIALAIAVPLSLLSAWAAGWTSGFKGSMLAPYVGADPTLASLSGAFFYGFVATGVPEELVFRGLIAGALFRRFSFWKANFIQAGIFLLPHLLILFVAPNLWPLVVAAPLALGLAAGWLRHASGSVWPAALIHAAPNFVGAVSVMDWRS